MVPLSTGLNYSQSCDLTGYFMIPHLGDWRDSGRAGRGREMAGEKEASEPAAAWGGEM